MRTQEDLQRICEQLIEGEAAALRDRSSSITLTRFYVLWCFSASTAPIATTHLTKHHANSNMGEEACTSNMQPSASGTYAKVR
jgi:hypothetical protein